MLLDLSRLSFPASAVEIFQHPAPLVLEIGFGDGRFLCHTAATHPEWNCLGADISRGSVARAFKHLRKSKLTNVQLYHGSGLFLLQNLLPPNSLAKIYVNFPDPWKKTRHAGQRLFQPSFFELLADRLQTNGTLLFTTDDAPYFEQAISLASKSGYYHVTECAPPLSILRTKYARKWLDQGRKIYHAEIQKQRDHSSRIPPVIHKEDSMHHVLLKGSIPVITEFDQVIHHFSTGHVVLLDVMQMIGRQGLVFIARSHEPELVQELFLQLRPTEHAKADLLLSIMNFGKPIATRGTSEAVKAVSRWLTRYELHVCRTFY